MDGATTNGIPTLSGVPAAIGSDIPATALG